MCVGGGGVQGEKIFVNDQSRSLGAPLAKCLEILCAAMPYSAAWAAPLYGCNYKNTFTETIQQQKQYEIKMCNYKCRRNFWQWNWNVL